MVDTRLVTQCQECKEEITASLDDLCIETNQHWDGYTETKITLDVHCPKCGAFNEIKVRG